MNISVCCVLIGRWEEWIKCYFPPHIDSVLIVTCTGLKDRGMKNIGLLPCKFRGNLPEVFLKAGRMCTTLTKVINYVGDISFPEMSSSIFFVYSNLFLIKSLKNY